MLYDRMPSNERLLVCFTSMHAAFANEVQIEKHRSKGSANLCDIWHSDINTKNSTKALYGLNKGCVG